MCCYSEDKRYDSSPHGPEENGSLKQGGGRGVKM